MKNKIKDVKHTMLLCCSGGWCEQQGVAAAEEETLHGGSPDEDRQPDGQSGTDGKLRVCRRHVSIVGIGNLRCCCALGVIIILS